MTSKQQSSFIQSSYSQNIYSGLQPNKVIKGKVSKIIGQYNCSNYFHVNPRRELMTIAVNLLAENESNMNAQKKIARLESELNISQKQLELAQNKLSVSESEITRVLSVCNNLTDELEDSMNLLDEIRKIANKKRNFSEIDL